MIYNKNENHPFLMKNIIDNRRNSLDIDALDVYNSNNISTTTTNNNINDVNTNIDDNQKLKRSDSSHSIIDIERETESFHTTKISVEEDLLELLTDEFPNIIMSSMKTSAMLYLSIIITSIVDIKVSSTIEIIITYTLIGLLITLIRIILRKVLKRNL